MKLLANENFPLVSVNVLKELGYDTKAIGVDDKSISDKQVIELASRENRLILTFDKDYGELIFRYSYKPPAGIIFLRLNKYTPDEPAKIVHKLLSDRLLKTKKNLTVYDGKTIRQRKY
ncbi:MAG: DUF5615 family PIN-like protein [Ignavibacteria bacterium]|nr:DUF5615 family PIN-like protein [Ignavibacteria bacterium]